MINAAIVFEPNAFDTQVKKVMGRNVAGATFLDSFVRHAEVDRYVGLVDGAQAANVFRQRVASITAGDPLRSARPVEAALLTSLGKMTEVGTVYLPDPQVARFAEMRRCLDQRAFSLCGITHTISSTGAMGMLCDVLTAPVQSWDAVIYTSRSVRAAAIRQQEHYADYLEQRLGVRPVNPIQSPVIPLGIDAGRFDRLGCDAAARESLRRRIGAAAGDLVVLFFGRLVFHAKAHPVPMYLGLQRATERLAGTGGRVHLVQTGHFPTQAADDAFRAAAARYCPDVPVHFLNGSDPQLADASWAAADLFVSLSDNIQESFGITPVEAMAAGLPCIVSDWDGYRDTVVDGETGVLIPTWMPPPGAGVTLADSYAVGNLTYDRYVGYASQSTAVDGLARNPERRRAMGEAGRRRAREQYDWCGLIRAYQELWGDLAARRRADAEIAPPRPAIRNPRLSDPFDVFRAHASVGDSAGAGLGIDPQAPELGSLLASGCNTFAGEVLLNEQGMAALVDAVRGGARSLRACLETVAPDQRVRAARSVGWLLKYGVLKTDIEGRTGS